ncbi:mCG147369 [Mus musculus]|nr:mCG147369 [Mus musculus]
MDRTVTQLPHLVNTLPIPENGGARAITRLVETDHGHLIIVINGENGRQTAERQASAK